MIPRRTERRAVVTGVGVVNAVADDLVGFQAALAEGRSGMGPIRAFDTNGLRNPQACEARDFFPETLTTCHGKKTMDRSSVLVLAAFGEALARSKLGLGDVTPNRGAVILGTTLGGSRNGFEFYRSIRTDGRRRPSLLRDYNLHAPGYRIAIALGLEGPNLVYSTACTSSNLALGMALDLIRYGRADVVIAGGFDSLSQVSCAGFSVMRNVSPGLCRPFDRDREGLVLGEGAAILVIEAEERAERRGAPTLARIAGWGVTSDAHHMTAPDISARQPAACISAALADAGRRPEEVDLVMAHGTGTTHNDAIEARALHLAFGRRAAELPCASIKSMVGHTLGAAGAMNALAALAARRGGFVPPTLNFSTPDPVHPVGVAARIRPHDPRLCLSNTFGFGGSSCCVLIEL